MKLNLQTSEAILVHQAKQGNREALAQLFEQLHQPLLNYLYHMLGHRQSAEDVAQDAFMRAFERLDQLGPPWDFKSWLYRIASNLAVDHLRSEKRYMDDGDLVQEEPTPTLRPIERNIEQAEQRRTIWKTLEALPTAYRQAVILKEMNNFSYQEIAQSLNCTYENARQLVHRARLRFRDLHRLTLALAISRPKCQTLGALLSAFHSGEVSDQERRLVQAHLDSCEECRQTLESMKEIGVLMASLPPFLPSKAWKSKALEQIWNKLASPSAGFNQPASAEITQAHPQLNAETASSVVSKSKHPIMKNLGLAGKGSSEALKAIPPWMWLGLFVAASLIGALILVAGLLFSHLSKQHFAPPINPVLLPSLPIVAVSSQLPALESSLTSTPSQTITPTSTASSILTPSITPTPTLGIPMATILQNAHCRKGPSTDYPIITSLLPGEHALIEGRNRDHTWWWLLLPASKARCWVWAVSVEASGSLDQVPLVTAPPKPTPTQTPNQGCWVFMPNQQKNICTIPCPPNPVPGGVCAP